MTPATNDVWVFLEAANGEALPVGLELLTAGRSLTAKRGGRLVGVAIGNGIGAVAHAAASHGADAVIAVDDAVYGRYTTLAYTHALATLAGKYRPDIILIGATHAGRDLAPRLACRLNTGLTADCAALAVDEATGGVEWLCPAFGGALMAAIVCPDARPQIGTIRPGAFAMPAPAASAAAEIIREQVPFPLSGIDVTLVESIARTAGRHDALEAAATIVAVGRGIGGPDGVAAAREFAGGLGAGLGATRPVVDSGWLGHDYQIGQSGKFVRPKLYFACGISGAVQHTVGVRNPGVVVAINKDPAAPIFALADYGIVADVRDALPLLRKILCGGREGSEER